MSKPSPDSPSVKVCGLGAVPARDATLEVVDALLSCEVVFSDLSDPGAFAWLSSLRPVKRVSRAEEVLAAARASGPAGLAVWGHPLITSALARRVVEGARREKIPCEVLAGGSPIGAVLAREAAFLGGEEGCKGARTCSVARALESPELLESPLSVIVYSEDGAGWDRLAAVLSPRFKSERLAFYALPAFERAEVALPALPAAARRGGALVVTGFGRRYAR